MTVSISKHAINLEPLDKDCVASLTDELLMLSESFGLSFDLKVALLCVKHLLYVQQINRVMNLTRITNLHEALTLHILDSLSLNQVLQHAPQRFLDMGTGAGFPGIPFHVVTGSEGILLDSVGKKIDAVNTCINKLELKGVTALHARLEDYALVAARSFDTVLARAVGQLPLLIEYGTPFLSDDGYLILAKANPTDKECQAGLNAAVICGLELSDMHEFDLPKNLGHRTIFVFHKISEPQIKLPRPIGMAKKNPIA